MKLTLIPFAEKIPEIRPAPAQRDWMDKTHESFAYRCLPLAVACSAGWEILNPVAFMARWDGGPYLGSVQVTGPKGEMLPESHFGSGVLTFRLPFRLKTDEGWNLWVGPPVNYPKHGISALNAVVEADWGPFTFTMNWKFTEPGWVKFEAGEPICHIFPIPRRLIEQVEPVVRPPTQEERDAFMEWRQSREEFNRELEIPGSLAVQEKWQKHYYRGLLPDGSKCPVDHQTKIRAKPFGPAVG